MRHPALLRETDHELLLRLLRTPTVGPLEAGPDDGPPQLWQAQRAYAAAAGAFGMRVVHHAAPAVDSMLRDDVPTAVRVAAEEREFLAQQPSLVLRLGPELPRESTVMFNVHLDTVAGLESVGFDGSRFTGRGAVDAKGPAVALLAGVRAAATANSAIGREVAVLIQAVSGEEGGALGTYGTRPLVEAGFFGRVNVFCEPTGLRYLPRSTASMTACIAVDGEGSIDDRPDAGHNATVLLGFLAQHLAKELDSAVRDGRVCVAGLHTGDMHNRVYGRGRLLLNLSYASSAAGAALEKAVAEAVDSGVREFADRFGNTREFARTAADAAAITQLSWTKRGMPCLHNHDPWAEEILRSVGVVRWPAEEPAFTCDAIWMDGIADTFTAVLGPGCLENNNAHASGEFVDLVDLEAFAATVAELLTTFSEMGRPA
ncbi:M20/M25/M40 family metallo-hydrolase [Saccharopolyspora phatthalungensis]|uniref:Acetylornithine deacetylase/succinyl-diaminopimelate desuccinylase-like protein n=1 Tax=Saccharopolyspora phatthalungensis TaxID=664693 RepID=A0A840QKD0_9PSEU|nr:M20/M25/M40 family metallo-hydrolase [Saccharopolyspora phatthalungensis]MBB5158793.1 acetylornithine deacetylase/succinyl-diaminopimelate desuccinylase-like protein [Saccharopolyspora phatthalungensis]